MLSTSSAGAVRRLAIARCISQTGTSGAFAALNFLVYSRTGSSAWLAATLLLTFGAAAAASPVAGLIADRFDRRRVMICSDLAAATLFASMSLLDSVGPLVAVAFAAALAEAPFPVAATAAIPNLVPEWELARANGLLEVAGQAGFLAGPLLGGVLLSTVGPGPVFATNGASFVVSAAICATTAGPFSGPAGRRTNVHIWAGVQLVRHDRVLGAVGVATLGIVLGLGMTMVATVPLVERLGGSASAYGATIAAWGAGSMAGALSGRRLTAGTEAVGFLAGCVLVAAMTIGTGLAPTLPWVAGTHILMGVGDGIAAVATAGIVQRRAPDQVRSRVVATLATGMNLGLAVSYLTAALLAGVLGPRVTYVVGGAVAGAALPFVVARLTEREESRS